jgi:hypothetical protein
MSQELNAQDLADDLHRLSGLPVVVAGIVEDQPHLAIRLGWAGADTSDVEAIVAAMLLACRDALETIAHSTPGCRPQLARVSTALDALRPVASAPTRGVH